MSKIWLIYWLKPWKNYINYYFLLKLSKKHTYGNSSSPITQITFAQWQLIRNLKQNPM